MKSRVSREIQARFCEGLGVKSLGLLGNCGGIFLGWGNIPSVTRFPGFKVSRFQVSGFPQVSQFSEFESAGGDKGASIPGPQRRGTGGTLTLLVG